MGFFRIRKCKAINQEQQTKLFRAVKVDSNRLLTLIIHSFFFLKDLIKKLPTNWQLRTGFFPVKEMQWKSRADWFLSFPILTSVSIMCIFSESDPFDWLFSRPLRNYSLCVLKSKDGIALCTCMLVLRLPGFSYFCLKNYCKEISLCFPSFTGWKWDGRTIKFSLDL